MQPPARADNSGKADRFIAPALGLLVLAAVAVLVPLPTLLRPGWPMNHEEFSFFERVEGFRRAFVAGNWYPLWTSHCHNGYGSPYPLYYHRLHTTLTALLALAIGTVRAVKAMTVLLLFAGGCGMRRLLRITGSDEPLAVTGGVLFIIAPYTLVDWYFRGAFAEMAAMMLLPWLFAELALFWTGRRHWFRLAAGVALLFFAHSMITYFFFVGLVPFFLLTFLPGRRAVVWRGALREWPWILGGALFASALVLPQVIVASRLAHYFEINVLIVPSQLVENHYEPFARYLADNMTVDDGWKGRLSLEINRYLLASLAVLVLLPGPPPRWRSALRVPLYPFVLLWTAICLLLQLPVFAPVFHALPKADFIQFSWRLLAFITIGSIFLFIVHAGAALRGSRPERIIAMVCVTIAVLPSALQFATFPLANSPVLEASWIDNHVTALDGPGSQGEFMLRGFHGNRPPLVPEIEPLSCQPKYEITRTFDQGDYQLSAETNQPCRVAIRQFQTPLLAVELKNARLVSTTPSPRIIVELEPGRSTVTLRPRGLWELLLAGSR